MQINPPFPPGRFTLLYHDMWRESFERNVFFRTSSLPTFFSSNSNCCLGRNDRPESRGCKVVFFPNLVVLMLTRAPSFSQLITSVMVSRLVLNLQEVSAKTRGDHSTNTRGSFLVSGLFSTLMLNVPSLPK